MNPQPGHDIAIIKESQDAVRDPVTGRPGYSSGTNFVKSATAHPVILYKGRHGEFFLVSDWYDCSHMASPSYLNLYCPVCKNSLRISEDNKKIDLDVARTPKFAGYNPIDVLMGLKVDNFGGRLNVEPFGCTWEIEPSLRRSFGFAVCNWRVVIENNVARDV